MNERLKRVVWSFARAAWRLLRFGLYVFLLLVGRVLVPVASLVTAGGFILFFFSVLFLREQLRLIVVGGCLAVGGILLTLFYDAALRLVAPDGVVIVSEV